jgi:hypothetical protein
MASSVKGCEAIREDFRILSPQNTDGDIGFGKLVFLRKNNPDGSVEQTKNGIKLTVRKDSFFLDTEDAKSNQRAEIRETKSEYLKPGQPVSYSWRMRAPDRFPKNNTRFVAVQFKAPYGNNDSPSPLFALRIENGQFFATIEQTYQRDREKVSAAINSVCKEGSLSADRDSEGNQLTILLAKDKKGLPPKRNKQFNLCSSHTKVENFNRLPKLNKEWVDFQLNVQSGPQGKVELYANGKLISRATGPFGDIKLDDKQYFKFGPYRDREDTTASLEFANFSRSCPANSPKK